MVHFSSIFVVALTCLASSVQYANILLIVILLQQSFVDDRWCATTFGNLTMVDFGGLRFALEEDAVVGDFEGCPSHANN